MAKPKVLVDTSGFYALLVRSDSKHSQASRWLEVFRESGEYAITTDYVVDETATLLLARRVQHLIEPFFRMLEESQALSMLYIDETGFREAKERFLKHLDQDYSFTDCTSMALMKQMEIKTALTKDNQFRQAGFKALLAD